MMSKNYIITTTDECIHEIQCMDDQGETYVLSFRQEIQLNEDVVEITTLNEEETFILHDNLATKLLLETCDDVIVLSKKACEVCFKIENACQDYQITWSQQKETLTFYLNQANDYCECIKHLTCGLSELILPEGLILCDEHGEHRGCIQLSLKAGTCHYFVLKEVKAVPFKISMVNGCGEVHVLMQYQTFHQSFCLNEQNHYQITFSHLAQGTYTFTCDEPYMLYDGSCSAQTLSITIETQPIQLQVISKRNCMNTIILHNMNDCVLRFSLFSIHYHEMITIEPYQCITLNQMPLGAYSIQKNGYMICVNGMALKTMTFCIEHEGVTHIHLHRQQEQACASLHLCFYEESLCADLMTPSTHCSYRISLLHEQTRYDLLLNHYNQFQSYLTSLPVGYYQVLYDSEVQLLLDGIAVQDSFLLNGQHCLQMIAPLKRCYDVTICLSGLETECFEGYLQSKNQKYPFCLTQEQQYTTCLSALECGEYQVILPCVQDYQITYQWNDMYKSQPLFCLEKDSNLKIQLEPFVYGGMLQLRLLKEDACGQLSLCTSGNYHIQMKGYGYSQTHCFNEQNGYELSLCHLQATTYDLSLCEGYAVCMQSDAHEGSCFELTKEDLAIDIILKYVAEDVVIQLASPQECVCLLCFDNEEEVLRFYAGNQYRCVLSNLAYGTYQIKGLYDHNYSFDDYQQVNCFEYDGNYLELCLYQQSTCELVCKSETNIELEYEKNNQRQKLLLNGDNQYQQSIYCQKYDEISFSNEDIDIYIEGEKYNGEYFQVNDEVLEVKFVPNASRCVLYMEKSQCGCMGDKVQFELAYEGQKEQIEFSQQRGIRLPKGIYHFLSDEYLFTLDNQVGTTFTLNHDQHYLMVSKKNNQCSLTIQSQQECSGTLVQNDIEYPFVLNAANQYLCTFEHLTVGICQLHTNIPFKQILDDQEVEQLELKESSHQLLLKSFSKEVQIVQYRKKHDVYTRQDLNDLKVFVNHEEMMLNETNNHSLTIHLDGNLHLDAQGEGSITYLINGVEYDTCEINVLEHTSVGVVEDLTGLGHLKIHAMMESNGGYRAILDQDDIQLHVSGLKETICLNKENDYTCFFPYYQYGFYQIDCDQEVSYLWNGEVNQGAIHHYGNNVLLLIVKKAKCQFTFTLAKECKCAQFALFNGANHQNVTLDENHRQCQIDVEQDGVYVIDDQDDYMYRIDDIKEIRYPVLKGDASHCIEVCQKVCPHLHCLSIEKKMMVQGEYQKPNPNDVFEVDIIAIDKTMRIRLDASNDFQMRLPQLACGDYEIKEVGQSTYETSYFINEGMRSSKALVHLHQDVNVCIINEVSMAQGSLKLKKVIESGNGELITPASGDVYRFQLTSTNGEQEIVLQASNQFQQWIYPLAEGIYTLKELNDNEYDVSYQVNQGAFQKEAVIVVRNGSCSEVIVKNQRIINQASLDVFQYLQSEDGSYVKPMSGTFGFLLKGTDRQKSYELNDENHYQVTLNDLLPGTYEIIANDVNSAYLINDATLQNQAKFNLEADSESVITIIKLAKEKSKTVTEPTNRQVLKVKI